MNCVFNGPPRAGKTTVVKRLKGEDVDTTQNSPSTGVVDEGGIIRIDFIPSCNVVTDQDWVEMEEDDEVQAFLNLTIIPPQTEQDEQDEDLGTEDSETSEPTSSNKSTASKVTSPPSQTVVESADKNAPAPAVDREGSLSVIDVPQPVVQPIYSPGPTEKLDKDDLIENESDDSVVQKMREGSEANSGMPSSIAVLRKAQLHCQQIRATRRLCKRHFLYISDTGGQPEFRKMISLLVPGPANTMIVFRICDEFNADYPVKFRHGTSDIQYSSFSIKETITDIVEHVYCSEIFLNIKGTIMFIGTHKDLIPEEKQEEVIMRMNKELFQILEQCPHYNPDTVIKSDGKNIIFCVNNTIFESEHKSIRSAVRTICDRDSFQVSVKPEYLLLAITLKGAQTTTMHFDECEEVALKCGILEGDIDEALYILDKRLMVIRVYELDESDIIVLVKPRVLINIVSSLLKFMIMRNKDVYRGPVISCDELKEIVTSEDRMEPRIITNAKTMIRILVQQLIIAPGAKSKRGEVVEFIVPSMFSNSMRRTISGAVPECSVPSIFQDSTLKSVTDRADSNQLLFTIKTFKFSVPSTLHSPVLCSLLQDEQWSIDVMDRNTSKLCLCFSKRKKGAIKNVIFTIRFFRECVSLCVEQEWNRNNASTEMLKQCADADDALSLALGQAIEKIGYGIQSIKKYCLSCFQHTLSTEADTSFDCTKSHAIEMVKRQNIWFQR